MGRLAKPCLFVLRQDLPPGMQRRWKLRREEVYPSDTAIFVGPPCTGDGVSFDSFRKVMELLGGNTRLWLRHSAKKRSYRWETTSGWHDKALALHHAYETN